MPKKSKFAIIQLFGQCPCAIFRTFSIQNGKVQPSKFKKFEFGFWIMNSTIFHNPAGFDLKNANLC